MNTEQALYPIREVSRLTEVNAITLRAWERRYGLIEPIRTESGHRLYTDEHIKLINKAVELTQQGVPISQVKALLQQKQQNVKFVQPAEFDDLEARLTSALANVDILSLQDAVDQLFIEMDEWSVLQIISRLDGIDKSFEEKTLWQSVLLPRLYSQLRFIQKRLNPSLAEGWLIVSSSTVRSQLIPVLLSMWLGSHHRYPLAFQQSKQLPTAQQLKNLQVKGIVLLVNESIEEFVEENGLANLTINTLLVSVSDNAPLSQIDIPHEQTTVGELFQTGLDIGRIF